ncbi:hypothetical protein STEG23_006594, partial [Scotinomys teguina]
MSSSDPKLKAFAVKGEGAAPEDFSTCPHSFKKKDFKKPRVCGVCRQTIDGQGVACRVCKYSCHKKCEAQ